MSYVQTTEISGTRHGVQTVEQWPTLPTTIPGIILTYDGTVDGWTITHVNTAVNLYPRAERLSDVLAALPAIDGMDWTVDDPRKHENLDGYKQACTALREALR